MAKGSSPDIMTVGGKDLFQEKNNGEDTHKENRESLVTQWPGLCVSTAGGWFWPLAKERRAYKPCEVAKKQTQQTASLREFLYQHLMAKVKVLIPSDVVSQRRENTEGNCILTLRRIKRH